VSNPHRNKRRRPERVSRNKKRKLNEVWQETVCFKCGINITTKPDGLCNSCKEVN